MTKTAQEQSGTRLPMPDTLNHWLRKAAITRAIVTGEPAKALCGEVFTPSSEGNGTTADGAAMICPLCQLAYEQLPPG